MLLRRASFCTLWVALIFFLATYSRFEDTQTEEEPLTLLSHLDPIAQHILNMQRGRATVAPQDLHAHTEVPPYPSPRRCFRTAVHQNILIHPISFAIPYEMILPLPDEEIIENRTQDFAQSIPMEYGEKRLFGHSEEWRYWLDLRRSRFALTKRRGGCDALRHYEILSQGAVPYFFDLMLCPQHTLGSLPRRMLEEVLVMPGISQNGHATWDQMGKPINMLGITKHRRGKFRFFQNGVINRSVFVEREYHRVAKGLLRYTRRFLSTVSLAKYIAERSTILLPRRVLILLEDTHVDDFMQLAVLHGFRAWLGGDAVDAIPHVPRWHQLTPTTSLEEVLQARDNAYGEGGSHHQHGKGMVFSFRVVLPTRAIPDNITQALMAGFYDLVVYPRTLHKKPLSSKPYFAAVTESHRAGKIRGGVAFIDGNDAHPDPCPEMIEMASYGTVFRREMEDVVDC